MDLIITKSINILTNVLTLTIGVNARNENSINSNVVIVPSVAIINNTFIQCLGISLNAIG